MIVVADLYQLNQRNKDKYIVDGTKTLERPNMKVEQSYVNTVNGNSVTNGKLFVVKDAETKEWKAENAANAEAKKDADKKRKLGITEEAEALIKKTKNTTRKRRTKAEIEAEKEG